MTRVRERNRTPRPAVRFLGAPLTAVSYSVAEREICACDLPKILCPSHDSDAQVAPTIFLNPPQLPEFGILCDFQQTEAGKPFIKVGTSGRHNICVILDTYDRTGKWTWPKSLKNRRNQSAASSS
jgi:hypothetical protein